MISSSDAILKQYNGQMGCYQLFLGTKQNVNKSIKQPICTNGLFLMVMLIQDGYNRVIL